MKQFIWIIPLTFMLVFEVSADYLSQKWVTSGKPYFSVIALIVYSLAAVSWLFTLKHGGELARATVVFSLISALLTVLMGILLFHEKLTLAQGIGFIFGFIGLTLILWE